MRQRHLRLSPLSPFVHRSLYFLHLLSPLSTYSLHSGYDPLAILGTTQLRFWVLPNFVGGSDPTRRVGPTRLRIWVRPRIASGSDPKSLWGRGRCPRGSRNAFALTLSQFVLT